MSSSSNKKTEVAHIAIVIDAENASLTKVKPIIKNLQERGYVVSIRRAIADWSNSGLKNWGPLARDQSLTCLQQFRLTGKKSSSDGAVYTDSLELCEFRGHLSAFAIVSRDSDFTTLTRALMARGKEVFVFGKADTPKALQNACTEFIDISGLSDERVEDDGIGSLTHAPTAGVLDTEVRRKLEATVCGVVGVLLAREGKPIAINLVTKELEREHPSCMTLLDLYGCNMRWKDVFERLGFNHVAGKISEK